MSQQERLAPTSQDSQPTVVFEPLDPAMQQAIDAKFEPVPGSISTGDFSTSQPDASAVPDQAPADMQSAENLAVQTAEPEPPVQLGSFAHSGKTFRVTIPNVRKSQTQPNLNANAQPQQRNFQDINDLVKLGQNPDYQTFHRPDGKFLSVNELEVIQANQDLIRNDVQTPVPPPVKPNPVGPPANQEPPAPNDPNTVDPRDVARNSLNDPDGQELLQEMGNALNRYTELLAKHERKNFSRRSKRGELEAARLEYEGLRGQVNQVMSTGLAEAGFDADAVDEEILHQDAGGHNRRGEVGLIADLSAAEAERLGRESKVVAWWMKQKGLKGLIAKAGVMAPVGLAAGVAGGVVLGPVAGAVAAGFLANRIAKNYMRSRVTSQANSASNARQHASTRRETQLARLRDQRLEGHEGSAREVTSAFSEGGERNNRRNRNRLIGSTVVGIAAGVAGGLLADKLSDVIHNETVAPIQEKVPVPLAPKDIGNHLERTHFGIEFDLDGKGLEAGTGTFLDHVKGGNGRSVLVNFGEKGHVIIENLKLDEEHGLTEDSIKRLNKAGYTLIKNSSNGHFKISKNQ